MLSRIFQISSLMIFSFFYGFAAMEPSDGEIDELEEVLAKISKSESKSFNENADIDAMFLSKSYENICDHLCAQALCILLLVERIHPTKEEYGNFHQTYPARKTYQ